MVFISHLAQCGLGLILLQLDCSSGSRMSGERIVYYITRVCTLLATDLNNIAITFTLHQCLAKPIGKGSKTSFEKNCFSAWASTLNMGLINKVDMVCLSPVGYGVWLTFRALALRRSRLRSSLLRRRANARNVSQTPYPTGDKHTISTLLIKPIFNR